MKEQFATPRRTMIEDAGSDVDMEDLIQREDMVVTVSLKWLYQACPLIHISGSTARWKGSIRYDHTR